MAVDLYTRFHRFYQTGLPAILGADGTSLYWALVQKSNELRDPQCFTFTTTEAKERSGISHPEAFTRARNKLIAVGLVVYTPSEISRQMGIYSDLDLDLDPATVSARLAGGSRFNHKSITPGSQVDHPPITPGSQPGHKSLTGASPPAHNQPPESGAGVTIKQTNENKPNGTDDNGSSLLPDGAGEPARELWGDVLRSLTDQGALPQQHLNDLRSCTATWREAGAGPPVLTVRFPAGALPSWRPQAVTPMIKQEVQDLRGRRPEVVILT